MYFSEKNMYFGEENTYLREVEAKRKTSSSHKMARLSQSGWMNAARSTLLPCKSSRLKV